MDERDQQRAFESRFLQQIEKRVRLFAGKGLPGKGLEVVPMPDGADAVRATLRRLEVPNVRSLIDTLPGTRATQITFRQGIVDTLSGKPKVRVRAQMLAPVEALVFEQSRDREGAVSGPIDREAVLDALARYELLPQRSKPTVVALASATGFTDSAEELVNLPGPPHLVLVGRREDGGWAIELSPALRKTAWAGVFQFETADERVKRLQYHLERNGHALETSGVALDALARELDVTPAEAHKLAQHAARADTRLMLVREGGQLRLARSPLADEDGSMNMWSTLRKWLGFKPSTPERVRQMTQQRVALESQRADVDKKISEAEKSEREGLQTIASEPRIEAKKQIATRVARTQRELKRHRAQAQVYTDQIEVLGTHIYHLTLKAQGQKLDLPSSEELAQEAAQAEQVLTSVSANADLARSIEVGISSPTLDAEVDDILRQAEQFAGTAAKETASAGTREPAAPGRAPNVINLPPIPQPGARTGSEAAKAKPELG